MNAGFSIHARIINFDDLVNQHDILGSFKNTVETLSKDTLVVVDFWTKPCPTCQNIKSVFDELHKTYADRITIVKVYVKKYLAHFMRPNFYPNTLRVAKVPRVLIFKSGIKVDDFLANNKQDVVKKVQKHLN